MHKRLDVFLEGPDDVRFFDAILRPILESKYEYVQTWQYASEKRERTKNYLRAIRAMKADCLFLKDINTSPCVTAKKEAIQKAYRKVIEQANIFIVVLEIESCYIAGLDNGNCKQLGIHVSARTDKIAKEQFNGLIPKKFDSRIDFMVEILKRFSIETAKRKNKSFHYFISRIE